MANASRRDVVGAAASKRDVRKGAIVDAAAALFVERGIKKTSIARVMDRAQLTRELFYYYFEDKDELVEHVVELYLRDVTAQLDATLAKAEEDVDPSSGFAQQMAFVVQGMRELFGTKATGRDARVSVMFESGMAGMGTRRVVGHLSSSLRATDSYRYYAERHGSVDERHFELVLYGIVGLLLTNPEISNEEISRVVCAALCGEA